MGVSFGDVHFANSNIKYLFCRNTDVARVSSLVSVAVQLTRFAITKYQAFFKIKNIIISIN